MFSKILAVRFGSGLVVGVLLPTTILLPYAVDFKYDKKFVGMVCNVTILISFVLIWLIIHLTF
ncbi:hypothetical protein [Paraliobacillus ryukyuensis]|uniref:hypothetical protein n=1 Tax=Paraliobacillus ryukyuensis TaxID=200904 RepID=UPI001FE3C464|nr:hypothetical protein [Paraliobacillus ryukyuensis]